MTPNPDNPSEVPAVNPTAAGYDLQENLRRLDRLANLGLVAAGVAHEIKNGLVAVSTFNEMLIEKGEDREMAELVRRELKRIDQLVAQMLRLAVPKPPVRTTVSLHQVVDHSLRLLEHRMRGRQIVLKRDYRAAPDQLHGDEAQLQQAVMNVLLNGVEAIGRDGELAVRTENQTGPDGGQRLILNVHDTGPGIAPANLSRVFEPFFTTKQDGTGLGLAICQRVVQEHQGRIELQSGISGGMNFIISLPASERNPPAGDESLRPTGE